MDGIRRVGGALLAVALASGMAPGPVRGQEAGGEASCRCVDPEGREIERCVCFVPPDLEVATRALRRWTSPRARIGVTVDGGWGRGEEGGDTRPGVRILDVLEDGPADEAGLREGDVIVSVDGRGVEEPREFLDLMAEVEPGDEVTLGYLRDGDARTAVLEAEENPRGGGMEVWTLPRDGRGVLRFGPEGLEGTAWKELAPDGRLPGGPALDELRGLVRLRALGTDPCLTGDGGAALFQAGSCVDGVELRELNPELGEYFAASEGVLVVEVREGAALGLRPGDVIVAVDGRGVETPRDVQRILRSYEPDEDVTLRVVRKGSTMEIAGRRR